MENLMNTHGEAIMVLLGFVTLSSVAGAVVGRYFKYKHTERLALIEKGLDLPTSELNLQKSLTLRSMLKLGILFCGLGLGVLMGFILQNVIESFEPPLPYFFAIPFFTGVSLIIFYLVSKD